VQSLITTCRLHEIDVYTYLVDVLQRVGQPPRVAGRRTHPSAVEAALRGEPAAVMLAYPRRVGQTPRNYRLHFGAFLPEPRPTDQWRKRKSIVAYPRRLVKCNSEPRYCPNRMNSSSTRTS